MGSLQSILLRIIEQNAIQGQGKPMQNVQTFNAYGTRFGYFIRESIRAI
jgi:hypothetical protein